MTRMIVCAACGGSYDSASAAAVSSHFEDPGHAARVSAFQLTPRPIASPVPMTDPHVGEDSDARQPTAREARLIAEAQIHAALEKQRNAEDALAAVTAQAEEAKGTKRFIWATAGVVLATVTVTVSTLAWGKGQIDAGVAPVEQRMSKMESRQDASDAKQQQAALEQVRLVTMVENLSKDRGLPVPAPAPKVLLPDGGSP